MKKSGCSKLIPVSMTPILIPFPVNPSCFGNSAPMYGPLLSSSNSKFSSKLTKFVITIEKTPTTNNEKNNCYIEAK